MSMPSCTLAPNGFFFMLNVDAVFFSGVFVWCLCCTLIKTCRDGILLQTSISVYQLHYVVFILSLYARRFVVYFVACPFFFSAILVALA